MKWSLVKMLAALCCVLNVGLILFAISKWSSVVSYLEALDPKSSNVKLVFVFGIEYGAGLVTMLVFVAICLRVLLWKGEE